MGASLTDNDLDSLHSRHAHFRAAVAAQFAHFDFLMLPSAPVNRLPAGQDYTAARAGILRYTVPFSLAGLPVVTLPGELIGAPFGTGIQLGAPQLEALEPHTSLQAAPGLNGPSEPSVTVTGVDSPSDAST